MTLMQEDNGPARDQAAGKAGTVQAELRNSPAFSSSVAPSAPGKAVRPQLDFLHGMRGLAALYVVFFHLNANIPGRDQLPEAVRSATAWLRHGYFAVDVFIVLSGFLLMAPVVSAGGVLPGGFWNFVKRRARRIIPPYFAAYGLFLLFWPVAARALARAGEAPGPWIDQQLQQSFTWKSLLAHGLLTHNLHADWICNGSNIFWTVALEWQIYFVFALLLLPLWRWFGTAGALLGGFAVGLAPVYLVPSFFCPVSWLVGLFALGMAGSVAAFSPKPFFNTLRRRVPWGWLAAALAGSAVALVYWIPHYYAGATPRQQWPLEALAGAAAVCLILRVMKNYGVPSGEEEGPARARCLLGRCLEWRPVIGLSLFSYSLYLTHDLVVGVFNLTVWRLELKPVVAMLFYFGVGVPLSLLFAYAFYLVIERPGLARRLARLIRFGGTGKAVGVGRNS